MVCGLTGWPSVWVTVQAMSAEGEGEDRVRGGVDHAEPDTVAGAALVGYGRCGTAPLIR